MAEYCLVEVIGVRVEMPSNQPIVLLKEIDGLRYLPIWLGSAEATAIAFVQQQVKPPRPLTHDLFYSVLETFNIDLESVYLTKLEDGIFYAQLNFADSKFLSARPSDAIALALRSNSPIMASLTLLDEAGIEIPDQAEDEVERFKEFLDQINPEDFLA
jgi:bifunctional DNase/RNase